MENKKVLDGLIKISLSDGRVIQEGQVEFIVAKNGVFKKFENHLLKGFVPVTVLPGLPEITEQLVLKLPKKIPVSIYFQIWHFFDEFSTEVYAQIFWNENKQEYFVYIPDQTVSGASVDYKRNVKLERKYKLICEIHSHNKMGAFSSGTDDHDEKAGIIYGVISTTNYFECEFRVKVGDFELQLTLEQIFNVDNPPSSWKKKVKEKICGKQLDLVSQACDVEPVVKTEDSGYKWWTDKNHPSNAR